MGKLFQFPDYTLGFVALIAVLVAYGLVLTSLLIPREWKNPELKEQVQLWWIMTACLAIIILVIPSIDLLYRMAEIVSPNITTELIDPEYYWSCEVYEDGRIDFDLIKASPSITLTYWVDEKTASEIVDKFIDQYCRPYEIWDN